MRISAIMLLFLGVFCGAPGMANAQIENERAFLLVAKAGMVDGNFDHTVVLAVRSDDTGPVGLILNRPSTISLNALFPNRPEFSKRTDHVFIGGPVEPDALLFAFRSPKKPVKGLHVEEDIYISGFSDVLSEIVKHPENAAQQRFFTGFASWAPGQLEDEIARGGWFVMRFDAKALFEMNPLTLYETLYKRASVPRIEADRDSPFTIARSD